jgi:hypothetical protein
MITATRMTAMDTLAKITMPLVIGFGLLSAVPATSSGTIVFGAENISSGC